MSALLLSPPIRRDSFSGETARKREKRERSKTGKMKNRGSARMMGREKNREPSVSFSLPSVPQALYIFSPQALLVYFPAGPDFARFISTASLCGGESLSCLIPRRGTRGKKHAIKYFKITYVSHQA